jgi:prepilin-type N-terminal cleavage/methylation domain-containing protein
MPVSSAASGFPSGERGYTLVELAIVLVIIGLIIGGILMGRDLLATAAMQAEITQIQQFNTAVNMFTVKYNYLPGDIPASVVTQLGFTAAPTRAGTPGRGNGNGLIEGYNGSGSQVFPEAQTGETAFFWEDLTTNSGLVQGAFNQATDTEEGWNIWEAPQGRMPTAKVGSGVYVYVYSNNGVNYFGLSYVNAVWLLAGGLDFGEAGWNNTPGVSVSQAFAIDQKIDDGLPQSGNVTAQYLIDANWPPLTWGTCLP